LLIPATDSAGGFCGGIVIIEVEVCNWAKFNPRADVKSCSWFRMSNDFFSDPDFYDCTIDVRIVWIFILSIASRKMNSVIKLNTKMVSDTLKISEDQVLKSLDFLKNAESIEILSDNVKSIRSNPIVNPMLLSATNERTNERDRADGSSDAQSHAEFFKTENHAEKNLPESESKDFRNPKDSVSTILKPDHLIRYWDENLTPKGFPSPPMSFTTPNLDKFFQINKLLREQGLSWLDYVQRVERSEFLTKKKRGGPPAITWLLKDINYDDVMAGKYDNNMSASEEEELLKAAGMA
jgi:hypothetical protein